MKDSMLETEGYKVHIKRIRNKISINYRLNLQLKGKIRAIMLQSRLLFHKIKVRTTILKIILIVKMMILMAKTIQKTKNIRKIKMMNTLMSFTRSQNSRSHQS